MKICKYQFLLAVVAMVTLVDSRRALAEDWPQFHGPKRDNLSTETGLLKQWPPGGPKLLWTASGIGHGFATVSIADKTIYTAGNIGSDTVITALDMDGKPKWTAKNGPSCRHDRPGARSTPTIDGERLYHENSYGDLACLEAKTGKPVWSVNILQKFGGKEPKWGLAESPLVDGNNVICTPGGSGAAMAALDKFTGKTVWLAKGTNEKPGYASPIAIDFAGVRQYVTMMEHSVIGVRADNGKLLWYIPHPAYADETVCTPIFQAPFVFVSTLTPGCSQLIELANQGDAITASRAWQNKALDNHHGGVVLVDGYLYGSTAKGKWACLEFKTGKVMHISDGVGKGSLTYADGMLYTYAEKDGAVGLVKATPDGHQIVSKFNIPAGGEGPCWAHPVVCGGRLYLRHGDFLYCYDVQGK